MMEIEKHFQYVEKRRQANQICSTRKCSLEARGGEARAGAGAVAGAAGGGEKFTRNGRKPQHFDWAAIKLFTIQSIQLWLSALSSAYNAAYACCTKLDHNDVRPDVGSAPLAQGKSQYFSR